VSDFREQVQHSLGSSYTIDRELGGGGMSRVYVARDATLRRDVVVKVLPPDLVAGVNVERFRREILVAAGLQHPHIVPVLASGEMDGLPWFTMPFVQGESLRQRLARGPMTIGDSVSILREVAKALAYAHERGVVHRDIKPDNVLITGGTAVVTDFGIAKALSASRTGGDDTNATRGSLTQTGMSIGTPMYMAPEQAAADPNTDARADIYSFGCMAYELLAGRTPFAGMPPQRLLAAHMGERPQPILQLRRDTPPLLADLVMRCLEKDPTQRPESAADVVRLLELATTTSGSAVPASSVLLGGRVRLGTALLVWVLVFGAAWILAKAAIVGIGLPSWVLPGALIIAGLGLPAILFTAFVQRTAHRVLVQTPALTPGGTTSPQGTMATIAMRASPHVTWRRTTRGGIVAFGGFVVLVIVAMSLRALGIGPAASLLAAKRITAREPLLVTDFTVRGPDSTLSGIVTEAMRSSLGQSSAITLVSPASIAGALGRMQKPPASRLDLSLARDLAAREGIKAIVDGEIASLGSGYVISVRLVTADSGLTLAAVQKAVDGPKELIAAVDVIGRELRGKIGESLRSVQNAPSLEQVTTPSIEALRAYSEGARAYDVQGDYALAISRLSQAVALDTGFAMAWRKLGAVVSAAGYGAVASDSMLANAFRLRARLSPKERRTTEASYYFIGPGHNRALAIAALQQALAVGDTALVGANIGLMYATRREYAKADSLFQASIRTVSSQIPLNDRAYNFANMGQLDRGRAVFDEMLRRFPSPNTRATTAYGRASFLADAGDYAGAERSLDSLVRAGALGMTIQAYSLLALVAATQGRLAQIPVRLAAMTAATPIAGRQALLTDSLMLSLVDVSAAEQPQRAIRRLEATIAAAPLASLRVAERDYIDIDVATVYARAGRGDKAKAVMAQRASELRDTALFRAQEPYAHRAMGEIALAEGRPADAVREFWKGDSLPDGPADECDACTYINVARAYDKASSPDSAIVYFEKFFASTNEFRTQADFFARGPALRRLGELYEAKNDTTKAAHYYQMFVDLWKNADAELQPQVLELRKRLARIEKIRG
jgi:eukaryotic-like serine/threonine-protein kinase